MRLLPFPNRVLDHGPASLVAVFVPQPLEDSLGRVPLLLRRLAVVHQDLLNDRQEGCQLPLRSRLTLAVTWRLVMRQDLLQRVPAQPILLAGPAPAQLVRQHLTTNLFPKLHVGSHSWASLRSWA